jgi:hypothetical protein
MARLNPWKAPRYNTHAGFGPGATDRIAWHERQRTAPTTAQQPLHYVFDTLDESYNLQQLRAQLARHTAWTPWTNSQGQYALTPPAMAMAAGWDVLPADEVEEEAAQACYDEQEASAREAQERRWAGEA